MSATVARPDRQPAPPTLPAPVPILLLRHGVVRSSLLDPLRRDQRLEVIESNAPSPHTVRLAHVVSAVLVVTSGSPLEALLYVLTAEIRRPIIVAMLPSFAREANDVLTAGAWRALTLPVRGDAVTTLLSDMDSVSHTLRVDRNLRLLLNPLEQVVQLGERMVRLSQREFALLTCLSERSGQPVSTADLYRFVWGSQTVVRQSQQIVAVYVCQLRQKLRRLGLSGSIATVHGFGYALADPAPGIRLLPSPARASTAHRTRPAR